MKTRKRLIWFILCEIVAIPVHLIVFVSGICASVMWKLSHGQLIPNIQFSREAGLLSAEKLPGGGTIETYSVAIRATQHAGEAGLQILFSGVSIIIIDVILLFFTFYMLYYAATQIAEKFHVKTAGSGTEDVQEHNIAFSTFHGIGAIMVVWFITGLWGDHHASIAPRVFLFFETREWLLGILQFLLFWPVLLIIAGVLMVRRHESVVKTALKSPLLARPDVTAFYKTTRESWAAGKLATLNEYFEKMTEKIDYDRFVVLNLPRKRNSLEVFFTQFPPLEKEFLVLSHQWFTLTNFRLIQRDENDNSFKEVRLAEIIKYEAGGASSRDFKITLNSGKVVRLGKVKNCPPEKFLSEMIRQASSPSQEP